MRGKVCYSDCALPSCNPVRPIPESPRRLILVERLGVVLESASRVWRHEQRLRTPVKARCAPGSGNHEWNAVYIRTCYDLHGRGT
jgi:hypothetical protein